MKKILKLSFIIAILFAFFMNLCVFATDEETSNSEDSNQAVTSTSEESEEATEKTSQVTTTSSSASSKAPQTTTVDVDNEKKEIGASEIINILLIATGIVIILLAIAIFIKIN